MRGRAARAGVGAALLAALLMLGAPVPAQAPPAPGATGTDAAAPVPPQDRGDPTEGDLPPPAPRGSDTGASLMVVPPAVPPDGAAAALGRAILTVDQEAMYRQSRWGLRAQAELAAQSRQVAADNDRAFADLVADEDALTAARATLPPDVFRERALRFDERVTAVRAEREAARNALAEMADLDRALFFQSAAPVLGRVMSARGALVVLDQRTVLIADERIDVTAATIAALDAELGDGRAILSAALASRGNDGAAGGATGAAPPGPGAAGTALDAPAPGPQGARQP